MYLGVDCKYSNAVFHAAETARLALSKACEAFEILDQPSTLAKLGFNRKTARAKANEAVRERVGFGFVQLNDYINGLESTWKSKQGRVSSFNGANDGCDDLLITIVCPTLSKSLRQSGCPQKRLRDFPIAK